MVKWKLPVISLLAFIGVCSCRVFEDRDVCNSYLTVDFTNVDKGIREWQMWLFNGAGELIYKDTVYRRSYASPYVVQVPRYGQVKCLLWGNVRGATSLEEKYSLGTVLLKKEGVSADSIYFCSDTISTEGEESYLKVVPKKEFATVDIYLEGWAGLDFEVEMKLLCAKGGFYVDGGFCGGGVTTDMVLYDLGDYYTHFRGRILRQPDTENIMLSLLIRKKEVDGSLGKVLVDKDIPLGMYLEENGYNIGDEFLGDIRMEVDYSYNLLTIKAEEWSASYRLVEEI